MRLSLLCLAWLAGCAFTAVEPTATREVPQVVEAAEAAPSPDEAEASARAEARERAEGFVRAQGYAESPPTVSGDAIVREGIEGSLADRLNSLDPHAVSVGRMGDGWGAVFRYVDPRFAGRGRQLVMPDGETPHFVHQDRLLNPPSP